MENLNEFETTEVMDTEVPTDLHVAAVDKKDEREWKLDDGTTCSKSAFVREQFEKHNKTRREISEEFDIPYRTVYGATINMENDAEPATRGRATVQQKVSVNEDNEVLRVEDGKYFVGGVEIEASEFELIKDDFHEVDRNDYIRDEMEAGKSRGAIADALGVSYGVVYAATKDLGGARKQHTIEYEGKEIPRNEYIKIRFEQGISKADIAKELDVDYAVVWNATKKEKSEQEKFEDAIDRLAKFGTKVSETDVETFSGAVEILRAIDIPEEVKEDKEN